MGERSADRAAVADLEVPDERDRSREQWHGGRDIGAVLDGRLGRGGADPQGITPPFDAADPVDPSQIDEVAHHGEAHVEQWRQALTAADHLGVVEVGEQADDASTVVGA